MRIIPVLFGALAASGCSQLFGSSLVVLNASHNELRDIKIRIADKEVLVRDDLDEGQRISARAYPSGDGVMSLEYRQGKSLKSYEVSYVTPGIITRCVVRIYDIRAVKSCHSE